MGRGCVPEGCGSPATARWRSARRARRSSLPGRRHSPSPWVNRPGGERPPLLPQPPPPVRCGALRLLVHVLSDSEIGGRDLRAGELPGPALEGDAAFLEAVQAVTHTEGATDVLFHEERGRALADDREERA